MELYAVNMIFYTREWHQQKHNSNLPGCRNNIDIFWQMFDMFEWFVEIETIDLLKLENASKLFVVDVAEEKVMALP